MNIIDKSVKKVVTFADFSAREKLDIPSAYISFIKPNAKVYITELQGSQVLKFLSDESVDNIVKNRRYEIATAIADVLKGQQRYEFYDFSFNTDARRMMCLVSPPKKVYRQVSNLQQAEEYGVVRSYFRMVDWLNILVDDKSYSGIEFIYPKDCELWKEYYEYVAFHFSQFKIVEYYIRWMRNNDASLWISEIDYSNPLNFVSYFNRQLGQYIDIIKQCRDRRYYIVGDGPGTASIACTILGVKYFSYEPNGIGDKARKLGIISSDKSGEIDKDDIVFLANVGDYVDYEQYEEYDRIVVDFSGKGADLDRTLGGRGSVYSSLAIELIAFPRRSSCLGLLEGKDICPITPLAKQICLENGIEVKEHGLQVTTDEKDDHMNLISREKPSDLRARKGHVKLYKGVFFTYYQEGQQVFYDDGFSPYYPLSYSHVRYVSDYHIVGNMIHVKSIRPEKVMGVIRDDGRVEKLFYIEQYENKDGVRYGVYRPHGLMFRGNNEDI